ncbi:MAG TPA: gliding motility protein GldN [Cyclobacteriaceae bacterium]|jgi:gliding motility associated protien GldN
MVRKAILFAALSTYSFCSIAQNAESDEFYRAEVEEQYNPNSINPIPKYEHHYKIRVWRTIDLREKQNKGFFSNNGEISRLIVDAVKSGEITDIYASDSLTTKISKEEFLSRLQAQGGITYDLWDPTRDWYTDEICTYNGKNYRALRDSRGENPETSIDDAWAVTSEGRAIDYLPRQMYQLRLMEDVIFDKRRSRLYYDVQAIQLIVPGAETATNVDEYLGWFKYKDLERVFRNHPQKAVWFNRQNTAQNKNFADAILLRLFRGSIWKIENPDDFTIYDVYVGSGRPYKEAVWATEWAEMQLMEKEHNLWEF